MRKLVWMLLLCGACEAPHIRDRESFCANVEASTVPAGSRILVAGVAFTEVVGDSDKVVLPFDGVWVELTVVGGGPALAEFDLRVCPGDCTNASDQSFSRQARARTDEDGILLYTIVSGASARGFVMLDFGDATCVQQVAPVSSSS